MPASLRVGAMTAVAVSLLLTACVNNLTHFVLSDTPYKEETSRIGDQLLLRLREA
ncbi:hypothetical protein [Streptomyces sp. NPDC058695]|uniref:hypothetical protein n=1 Tax=Streptomyces sp. NPDC058695 TaxID=3346604 RepID=UPI0036503357